MTRSSAQDTWTMATVNAAAPYDDHDVMIAVERTVGVAYFAARSQVTGVCVGGRVGAQGTARAVSPWRARDQFAALTAARFARPGEVAQRLNPLLSFWLRLKRTARVAGTSDEQIVFLITCCASEAARLLTACHSAN